MNVKTVFYSIVITTLSGCAQTDPAQVKATSVATPLLSGIDKSMMDTTVRPQDDFYSYANGTWLKNTEIPADKSRIGSFDYLRDQVDADVRAIIEAASNGEDLHQGSPEQMIGDLYKSFLDETRIDETGLKPLQPELAMIDAIDDYSGLAAYFAYTMRMGLTSPIAADISEDFKDPTRNITFFLQSGLGLPDRDYYFDESDKGREYIKQYHLFLTAMFAKLGHSSPETAARTTYELEQQLAGYQRNPVENRQYDKWDNKYNIDELKALMPDFDWPGYIDGIGIGDRKQVSAAQPEYFEGLNKILKSTPLPVWRDYLKLHLISDTAPLLSQDIDGIHFAFYNKILRGEKQPLPRWQRGVKLVNYSLGELVGQVYVKKHFPPQARQRMLALVDNLVESYRESITSIDWMSDETKHKALIKLEKFLPKIGYPDKWKDYANVTISADKLVANVRSADAWNQDYNIAKLDKPAERSEWGMTPQTVNAYYHPIQNTINFPAAILQPPFFNMAADDAVNYGAIGMVIGHEIGHGFDDQGSKFNGDGYLKNWWTDGDRSAFEGRTTKLIEQYNRYEVLPGLFINGELTQGENIGDLAGVSIAYKAYRKSLNGKPAPVIDGFTGDQRFFLGFAQVFLGKMRDDRVREQVKTDPHSPARFRVNGVVINVPAFYQTYDLKQGDRHFLPEKERVTIW